MDFPFALPPKENLPTTSSLAGLMWFLKSLMTWERKGTKQDLMSMKCLVQYQYNMKMIV